MLWLDWVDFTYSVWLKLYTLSTLYAELSTYSWCVYLALRAPFASVINDEVR